MSNKNKYLIEIVTEDLPYLELNNILKSLHCKILNRLLKNNVKVLSFKSYITIRRIAFLFRIYSEDDFNLLMIFEVIFSSIKFKTNMRWNFNDKTFVRPLVSYIFMKNYNLIDHSLFNVKSNNLSLICNSFKKKFIKVNTFNYFNELKKNKILLMTKDRKFFLKKNIFSYLKKHSAHIILEKNSFNDMINSFECLNIIDVKLQTIEEKIPLRIIVSTVLNYGYMPLLSNCKINYFLVIIDSIQKKNVRDFYQISLKNKLIDILCMYEDEKFYPSECKLSYLKSIILNSNYDTLYLKIYRNFKLAKYLSRNFYLDYLLIKKIIILINLEVLNKLIFEYPNLTGLLFTEFYNDNKIKHVLHDYNSTFNKYFPKNTYSLFLLIIENLDNLVSFFLSNNIIKGKNDPYNLKGKMLIIIRSILKIKLYFNFKILIKKSLSLFDCYNNLILNKIFKIFIDRLKFNFKLKNIDVVNNKNDIYKLFLISKSFNYFLKYKIKNNLFLMVKRIEKFLYKNNISALSKLNKNLILEFDEKILFFHVIKQIKISKILIKNHLYFEYIKFLLNIENKINNFFKNIFIMSNNVNMKNNRLKLLMIIKFICNKIINLDGGNNIHV